ncbi:MAG: tRNA uridine-5-carboxymethylaminomethyl(34) synthesis GTPase MnmE [SAR324 cluster bacterium]|nr:tRNA uridine-5-carboxymethylaminomethyl(34) synthesis GTPase MnmE [SAR324 cluster bacterium]
MKLGDTIAAISTALGPAGIGVIRISGNKAIEITEALFHSTRPGLQLKQAPSHHFFHGWVYDGKQPIDEVMIALMKAPHSYTTEDIVEIQCHGSILVLQNILELVLNLGVRLADPGEFTQRAFLHGRMDLTQVEAVSDLINARSKMGIQAAVDQLKGKLFKAIDAVREKVFYVAALIEASIDFSDEDEEFTHREDCILRLRNACDDLENLLASAEHGKMMRSGLGVALIGLPNVGKSSLLNAMLKENRAIVTDIPGTTRDIIEESIQIKGLAVRLIDTAGIRKTEDLIENEGMQRSRDAFETADLILLILDSSCPLNEESIGLLQETDPENTVVILNKKDLLSGQQPSWIGKLEAFTTVAVSAKYEEGLEELKEVLFQKGTEGIMMADEQVLITNVRQQQAAKNAFSALQIAIEGLENELGEEFLAVDLADCLRALGEIVGETTAEDLLNRIFSEFCIGK